MRMTRIVYGAGAVVATALMVWGGVAFACSPQPAVYSLVPESAAPGETVEVRGQAVRSASPVEIRWNGVKGDLLATTIPAGGGMFSVPVRIPDVAPGIYSMVAVTVDDGVARIAFEATAPAGTTAAAAAPAQLWPSLDAAPSSAPASSGPNAFGVALLGIGLVGLFAGSTVAVARRRRAPVGSNQ